MKSPFSISSRSFLVVLAILGSSSAWAMNRSPVRETYKPSKTVQTFVGSQPDLKKARSDKEAVALGLASLQEAIKYKKNTIVRYKLFLTMVSTLLGEPKTYISSEEIDTPEKQRALQVFTNAELTKSLQEVLEPVITELHQTYSSHDIRNAFDGALGVHQIELGMIQAVISRSQRYLESENPDEYDLEQSNELMKKIMNSDATQPMTPILSKFMQVYEAKKDVLDERAKNTSLKNGALDTIQRSISEDSN